WGSVTGECIGTPACSTSVGLCGQRLNIAEGRRSVADNPRKPPVTLAMWTTPFLEGRQVLC
ncbi:MAG: hypothetical protein ACXAB4_01980, partial [Candidatus Hodarchaeales archaeon]